MDPVRVQGTSGLLTLGWDLLKLGAQAFGGLGTTLALLQRRLVDERGWLRQSDISEGLAFTRALPGSTGIQIVAYLGWRLHGWPGAIVATVAFIAPATLLMILAAAFSLALPDHASINGALTGLQVAVVGLLAASMWRLARSAANDRLRLGILLACCVLGFLVNALVVIAAAGLVGALAAKEKPRA
jgi:chromate transporter